MPAWFHILRRGYLVLHGFKPNGMFMSTSEKKAGYLFGIDVDPGTVYFASSASQDSRIAHDYDALSSHSASRLEVLNGVLYNVCNTNLSEQDVVKSRIDNRALKNSLSASLSCDAIWSSFLLYTTNDEKGFRSGFAVKFSRTEGHEQNTKNIARIARSLGLTSIAKLVPNRQGFLVDIISCETSKTEDCFELLPVEYPSYHPSFDYGPSVFKSLEETRNVFGLANKHSPLPEINILEHLAKTYMNNLDSLSVEAYPYPFIVIEGLDGVGKSTLVSNLGKRLGAKIFHTPPSCISQYRELFVKQSQPVCRAFYSLGNYLIAEDIKKALMNSPVVLDRYWYSSAAYAIAKEGKCGNESNIPRKSHPLYQWPRDLLKPSAVILLTLGEKERKERMRIRGCGETDEEAILGESQLLRERLMAAYKNMADPACIVVDAAKNREEVCEDVLKTLRQKDVLTLQ